MTRRRALAPNITGMARKKVNSATAVREQPSSRPPMIVEPEREVPGTMESTWKAPMPMAVFQSSSSRVLTRAPASASSERVGGSAGEAMAKCLPPFWEARGASTATTLSTRRSRTVSIAMKATP